MAWILLLVFVYFVKIKFLYILYLIGFVNFLRGVFYIKKYELFIKENSFYYTDEEGMLIRRGNTKASLLSLYWSIRVYLAGVFPTIIFSLLYDYLLVLVYFHSFDSYFNFSLLREAFFVFLISDFTYFLGMVSMGTKFYSKNDLLF